GDLGRELPEQGGVRAVGPGRGQHDRGPALVDLADALERLSAGAEERLELRFQLRVGERLSTAAVLREDRRELLPGHERGQDQVDEAALVALPAPVVKAARGVDVKGPVAAAERPVVLRQRREPFRYPQLGPVAQRREVVRQGRRASLEELAEAGLEGG